jgi:hypothetical protein
VRHRARLSAVVQTYLHRKELEGTTGQMTLSPTYGMVSAVLFSRLYAGHSAGFLVLFFYKYKAFL